ncbi:MAG: phosphoribosylglycinamide formyltransferase [Crocinitomicaceae bacterium]|nr:phosphoribosylglycinamide formyltransferase [Crocinitomicaceae bacterium]
MKKIRIAIFASGTGSNAINMIRFFENHPSIEVGFVLSNKSDAPVLNAAQALGVEVKCYDNKKVADGDFLVSLCQEHKIDWVVLAGYLRLIPTKLIEAFPEKIINLHPSLLPNYGGKGMFGSHVHKAVIENKETESGITIHFVNQEFDKGKIIAQFRCTIAENEGVSDLEKKIRYLEQGYLPTVIQNTILA